MGFFDFLKKLKEKADERNSQLMDSILSATDLDKNKTVSALRNGFSALNSMQSPSAKKEAAERPTVKADPVTDFSGKSNAMEKNKPQAILNKTSEEEELSEEEMKQLDDLLKRMEALESRIADLEKRSVTAAPGGVPTNRLTGTVKRKYVYLDGYCRFYIRNWVVLSNGRMGTLSPIATSECNYTVGQTRKVADMFGHKYDSKTKREALGFELVSKYGDGEWAFIGKNAVDANGVTYFFDEKNLPYELEALNFAKGEKVYDHLLSEYYKNEPLAVDSKWTPEETTEKLIEFVNSLVRK